MLHSVGIHLLILSNKKMHPLPTRSSVKMQGVLERECLRNHCTLHAMHVQKDHVHVLIEAHSEQSAAVIVPEVVDQVQRILRKFDPKAHVSDEVHITLLPPWHLDVVAAFVRDQDNYHRKNSVQDELRNVFLPSMLLDDALDADVQPTEHQTLH